MRLPRTIRILLLLTVLSIPLSAWSATFLNVDVLSLTLSAHALSDLQSMPAMTRGEGLIHMPFYFRVHLSGTKNLNWALELFSNNQKTFGSVSTPDGLLRGLRGRTVVSESIPLYWQVYNADQNVPATWGTPASVTATAGGLGLYPNTLHYWGTIYDVADVDKAVSWGSDRAERFVASVNGLGDFPQSGRTAVQFPIYIYFGGDLRSISTAQDFSGLLTLQLENYPIDFSRGCFATPNPVKPVLGQRVYFNFFTNNPDSKITIKIFDPTGFPVVTLRNTRYWDGRNSNYQYVEGGLYLYQIQVEGQVISGTVVVIK
ncbi:T9SS type A sorting domain-containing protein [bacterium]|nr:T9SS type A sorting domain-containing protein [bacterium]